MDLPGTDPNGIYVQAEGGLLSITAERKTEEDGSGYRETFCSKLERPLALPQGVEADNIVSRYENGVLEIWIRLLAHLARRKDPDSDRAKR